MRATFKRHARPPPPPFVRDPGTWASYLLLGYFSFVLSTFGGVLPALRLELGLSFFQASQHSSLFAFGLLLASLGGERLAQRFGAERSAWLRESCWCCSRAVSSGACWRFF